MKKIFKKIAKKFSRIKMNPVPEPDYSLKDFKLTKILNCDHTHKFITLLGKVKENDENDAVIVLYKDSFPDEIDYEAIVNGFENVECVHNVRLIGDRSRTTATRNTISCLTVIESTR